MPDGDVRRAADACRASPEGVRSSEAGGGGVIRRTGGTEPAPKEVLRGSRASRGVGSGGWVARREGSSGLARELA